MAFSSWISSFFKDDALNRVLDRTRVILEEITNKELVDGSLLRSVSLTSGTVNNVPHKLSRNLIGYIIVTRSANCTIWDSQLTNAQKDTYLKLNTSANVVVDIWVF